MFYSAATYSDLVTFSLKFSSVPGAWISECLRPCLTLGLFAYLSPRSSTCLSEDTWRTVLLSRVRAPLVVLGEFTGIPRWNWCCNLEPRGPVVKVLSSVDSASALLGRARFSPMLTWTFMSTMDVLTVQLPEHPAKRGSKNTPAPSHTVFASDSPEPINNHRDLQSILSFLIQIQSPNSLTFVLPPPTWTAFGHHNCVSVWTHAVL